MSYYYNYYGGYKLDGKIFPLGPYNDKGELETLFYRSQSFASELYERFDPIKEEMISDKLRKEFVYTNFEGEQITIPMKWLPLGELPNGSFVKGGYFLIDDVNAYLCDGNTETLQFNRLSPEIYAAKLGIETMFGPPKPKQDEEGFDISDHSVTEYMYFAYPDELCEEYEAFIIRKGMDPFDTYLYFINAEPVIIETEG